MSGQKRKRSSVHRMDALNRLNKLIKWTSEGFVYKGSKRTTDFINETINAVEKNSGWRFKPTFTLCATKDTSHTSSTESEIYSSESEITSSESEVSEDESGSEVEQKSHSCTVCDRVFSNLSNLRRHRKNIHPQDL
jgi:hypothetical protein